jgi:hypothetical protein
MAVHNSRSAKARRHSAGRYHTPAILRNKLLPQSGIAGVGLLAKARTKTHQITANAAKFVTLPLDGHPKQSRSHSAWERLARGDHEPR